jgi:hypothetical protein
MKRSLALAAFVALLAAPAAAQQISFKLTGGWTFIQGDDYKAATDGRMGYLGLGFSQSPHQRAELPG